MNPYANTYPPVQPQPETKKSRLRAGIAMVVLFVATVFFGYLFITTRDNSLRKDVRIERLVKDSTLTHQQADSLVKLLDKSMATILWWEKDGEKKDSTQRETNALLTSPQRLTRYLKNLVGSGDLDPVVAAQNPKADDPRVVAAGLNATDASNRKTKTITNLSGSIAGYEAKIDQAEKNYMAAQTSNLDRRVRAINVEQRIRDKKKGGIWPFNVRRWKEHEESAKDVHNNVVLEEPPKEGF